MGQHEHAGRQPRSESARARPAARHRTPTMLRLGAAAAAASLLPTAAAPNPAQMAYANAYM